MGTIEVFKKIIALIFVVFIIIVNLAYAKVIGTNGATYKIEEPDAYEELMAKVAKADWTKIIKKYQTDTEKLAKVSFNLGKAKQNKKFAIDPVYTLPFDVVDDKGRILYPNGFRFNPLDYIQFPYRMVFFNAKSDVEISWVKKQSWINDWSTMLIATDGDISKTEEKLGKVVYAVDEQMVKKFRISRTPSILVAKDKQIIVEEIGVYEP